MVVDCRCFSLFIFYFYDFVVAFWLLRLLYVLFAGVVGVFCRSFGLFVVFGCMVVVCV